MKKLIFLLYLVSSNINCMYQEETPLEVHFNNPISEFNLLSTQDKFLIGLHYCGTILERYPDQIDNLMLSNSLKKFLENQKFINYKQRKVILIIENEKSKESNLNNENLDFKVYNLIYSRIRDENALKNLPNPNLFETRYLNFKK